MTGAEIRHWIQLVVLTAFLSFISWLAYGLVKDVKQTTSEVRATSEHAQQLIATANHELTVNGDEAHRILLEAGLTAREARLASQSQRQFWDAEVPKLAAKTEITLDRTNSLLESVKGTSQDFGKDAAQVANAFTVTADSTKQAVASFTTVAAAASKDLSAPQIPAFLDSLDQSGKQLVGVSTDIHHTTTDISRKVDDLTHPTLGGKIASYTLFGFDLLKDVVQTYSSFQPPSIKLQLSR